MIPLRELLVPTIKPSHWRLDASHRTQTVTDWFLTSSPRGLHGTQTVTDLFLTSSPRGLHGTRLMTDLFLMSSPRELHGTQTRDRFISYELSEGASWDPDSWSIYFLRALREGFMGPRLVTDLFLMSSPRELHGTQTRDQFISYELSERASWDPNSWPIYFLRALWEGLKGPRLMTNLFLTSYLEFLQ